MFLNIEKSWEEYLEGSSEWLVNKPTDPGLVVFSDALSENNIAKNEGKFAFPFLSLTCLMIGYSENSVFTACDTAPFGKKYKIICPLQVQSVSD